MTTLVFDNLVKAFPGVNALRGVSFAVESGKAHALVGENGAGKSTLLKILGGEYRPDRGGILLDGVAAHFSAPSTAIAAGIALIHQELQYIPELSVAENLLLGRLPRRSNVFVRWNEAYQRAEHALTQMGLMIDPRDRMMDLSIGMRQMVEIAKALMRHAQLFAFDEPTSSLSARETEILFRLIRQLRAKGSAIIYVSHRLDEIFELCDCCTVLRDGQKVAHHSSLAAVSRGQLVSEMVGRDIRDLYGWSPRPPKGVKLKVNALHGKGLSAPVSFELQGGEILGLFGLVGSGRTELCRLLFGAVRASGGEIQIAGQTRCIVSPQAAIEQGLAFCPEDRHLEGIIGTASVAENITISARRAFLKLGAFLNHGRERATADRQIEQMRIKTPSRDQLVSFLSGGNQQKTIISRWLADTRPLVYLMDEPTRGIDVGAKFEIYQLMYRLAEAGHAILFTSSELPELLGVADRICVMREGALAGCLDRQSASEEALLTLALPVARHPLAVENAAVPH